MQSKTEELEAQRQTAAIKTAAWRAMNPPATTDSEKIAVLDRSGWRYNPIDGKVYGATGKRIRKFITGNTYFNPTVATYYLMCGELHALEELVRQDDGSITLVGEDPLW